MAQQRESVYTLGRFVLTFLTIISATSILLNGVDGKPQHMELDQVDICLFTCDFCFSMDEILLKCANDCLETDATMSPYWRQQCPYFGYRPLFSTHNVLHKKK